MTLTTHKIKTWICPPFFYSSSAQGLFSLPVYLSIPCTILVVTVSGTPHHLPTCRAKCILIFSLNTSSLYITTFYDRSLYVSS